MEHPEPAVVPLDQHLASVRKLGDSMELEDLLDELETKYGRDWVLAELYGWETKKRA